MLGAALLDPCRVTALQVDTTPALQKMIDWQLKQFSAQLDTVPPNSADLRPRADSFREHHRHGVRGRGAPARAGERLDSAGLYSARATTRGSLAGFPVRSRRMMSH